MLFGADPPADIWYATQYCHDHDSYSNCKHQDHDNKQLNRHHGVHIELEEQFNKKNHNESVNQFSKKFKWILNFPAFLKSRNTPMTSRDMKIEYLSKV